MGKVKILIQAFSGYGNQKKINCRGRILVNKNIEVTEKDSLMKKLVLSYKRAESDEIPKQKFNISFRDIVKKYKTNKEGYYHVKERIKSTEDYKKIEKIQIHIDKENFKENWFRYDIRGEGKIFFPSEKAKFGVISDIDDTILKTDVLSTLKWKIFYNTIVIPAAKRAAIWDSNLWYNKLSNGAFKGQNPFFYVSHSPWNLYDYLQEFLKVNKFPDGPVLLRDFGLKAKDDHQEYSNHKRNEIINILKTYPKLPFILIGDGGEKDAHIYLKIKEKYPKRISAIFIRRLGDKKHQAKIERIAKGHEEYFFFIKTAKEGHRISAKMGFIPPPQKNKK